MSQDKVHVSEINKFTPEMRDCLINLKSAVPGVEAEAIDAVLTALDAAKQQISLDSDTWVEVLDEIDDLKSRVAELEMQKYVG